MKFPTLTSTRLYLREHTPYDQAAYYDLLSNRQAVRYYGRAPLNDEYEAVSEIESLHKSFESHKLIKWALLTKNEHQYIGCVGVKEYLNVHKRGTLSCIITPKYWGCGYAFEALSAIIDYCFEDLHLNRLQAFVDPQNDKAMSLFDKLGFKMEAMLKEYEYERNKHIDISIWGLLKVK